MLHEGDGIISFLGGVDFLITLQADMEAVAYYLFYTPILGLPDIFPAAHFFFMSLPFRGLASM